MMRDLPDFDRTVGDMRLSAWATSENSCRIQTNDPEIVRQLRKVPDIERVGFSITNKFLRLFAVPYTLDWTEKNVVEKIGTVFLRKYDVRNSEIGAHCAGSIQDESLQPTLAEGVPA
jgi:hypothetical protein